ncbi:chemotaxis protein CheW [Desulfuromonas sp.]|uniref:chemotaxis protein CheW n=1 Tax=Desulfuromonas sp. TaxID=892 RepID=UPI0025BD9AE4|nr:chemotaxis protein CheW [Desulfuromonas sp.]
MACFRVGEETYALDILRIKEIIRPQKLTPVPKAPAFIEGVINLRGAVIPVVDLRKRFEQSVTEPGRKTRIIICAMRGKVVGLLVDDVYEVCRYGRQEVHPAPQFLKGRGAQFFLGVCRREDDLVMVLDLEKILSSEEKIDLEKLPPLPNPAEG